MKRGIFFILLAIALAIAFIYSLAPESAKSKVEGASISINISQKNESAEIANEPTTTSTTRAPPIIIGEPSECRVNADCGISYLASCHCDGDDLYATQYIPLCVDGSCVWKSKTDELFCRGREYESSDNSTGQRCVNGFGRCMKNSEVEGFFVLRPNVSEINDTNEVEYSSDYRGYRFRYNGSEFYSGASLCYENRYYIFDYKNKYNEPGQIIVSWNRSAILGSIVVKLGGIIKDLNGSDNPVLWARKTRKNDTGAF
ncbi:MAG: hypothetical protein WAX07_07920 [Candidatus Altiarchaeia archaeon]